MTMSKKRPFKVQIKRFVKSMDGFEWLVHLDEEQLNELFNDFRVLLAQSEGDIKVEISIKLYEWKASAEALSDPELVDILTEPVPEPLGTPAADYLVAS